MGQTKTFRVVLLSCLFFLGGADRTWAQFGSLVSPGQAAQARSQDELDAYLRIMVATQPPEIVKDVDAFAAAFPKSELLGLAYQSELVAFEQLNDFDGVLRAGEKALQSSPGNLNTLLILAPAMASRAGRRPDASQLLTKAETYARQALDGIEKTRLPHKVSLEHWNLEKRQMQSQAHEVLGSVALQRGQLKTAIPELETAITLSPAPQGIQFLRLGLAFASAGQKQQAAKNLRQGADLGPGPVRDLALAQLRKLKNNQSSPK
jgi:tetratricopeptide (TPR) repeat protein